MNILIVGDVYGKVGRETLARKLEILRKDYLLDFVIVNGENISHGKSINKEHYSFLKEIGVDLITGGNHSFDKPDAIELFKNQKDVLRPLNFNPYSHGKGTMVVKIKGKKVRITNLIGTAFMGHTQNPYFAFDEVVRDDDSDIHIVDFHAEATAEKIALAWNYDGKITALIGTHTHVQTNDERILPKGTGFISDIGMTGPYNSIIGANPDEVIYRQKTGLPARFKPASGPGQFNGVVLVIDDQTNKIKTIKKINITPDKIYSKDNN